jgi:hypothetical protein
MRALVTFESVYGNTRAIAEAIGKGLSTLDDVAVRSHDQLTDEDVSSVDLVVVGAPTHMHGLPTSFSRKMAAKASEEEGVSLDPSATADPGIRSWLTEQSGDGRAAAAFDTRADKNPALTGLGCARHREATAAARGRSRSRG